MKINKFLNADYVHNLFKKNIEDWHKKLFKEKNLDKLNGLKKLYTKLLFHNYTLWHLEDKARVKDVNEKIIADVKYKIDVQNQLRNNTIELIDEYIVKLLKSIKLKKSSYINTETTGAAIDRLCIITLKIFHMEEETNRKNVSKEHIIKCKNKLYILNLQVEDLKKAINLLITKIYSGEVEHKIYRQMKMYNDPTLNPQLYKKK